MLNKKIFACLMLMVMLLMYGCSKKNQTINDTTPTVHPTNDVTAVPTTIPITDPAQSSTTEPAVTITPEAVVTESLPSPTEQPSIINTSDLTEEPKPTSVPDSTIEPAVTSAPSKSVLFYGTVTRVEGGVEVTTNELNKDTEEIIQLKDDVFFSHEKKQYPYDEAMEFSWLKVGDIVSIEGYVNTRNGVNYLNTEYSPNLSLVESIEGNDLLNEKRITDFYLTDGSDMIVTYDGNQVSKPYDIKLSADTIESILEYMETFTIYEADSNGKESLDDCDYVFSYKSRNNIFTKVGLANQRLLIYEGNSQSSLSLTHVYTYYRNNYPEIVSLYHLLFTKEDISAMTQYNIDYKKVTGTGTYSMRTGYSIDLDGDGKLESLYIGTLGDIEFYKGYDFMYLHSGERNSLTLYVNGKDLFKHELVNTSADTFDIIDMDKSDGKYELVLHDQDARFADHCYSIYRYENGAIRLLGKITSLWNDYNLVKDSENPETYFFCVKQQVRTIHFFACDKKIKITKTGEFIYPELFEAEPVKNTSLLYTVKAYKDRNLSSESVVVKPQKISFCLMDGEHWLQIQLEDQSKIWIYLDEVCGNWNIQADDILDDRINVENYRQDNGMLMFDGIYVE